MLVFPAPHRIYVGDKLFEKPNIRPSLTDDQMLRYIRNHYHHEQAHGLFTERDMPAIQKALDAIKAPFQVFNLMEDAVIEHRYRDVNDYQFRWLEYETLFFSDRPETLLLALIQAEGDVEAVKDQLGKWTPDTSALDAAILVTADPVEAPKTLAMMFPRVLHYYEKLCKCRSTMAVMPVLNAWLNEFGRQPPPPPGHGGAGMGDMSISIRLANKEEREAFDATATSVSEKPMAVGGKGKAVANPEHDAESSNGEVLSENSNPVCPKRAQVVADRLRPLFKQAKRSVPSLMPTKRISARHMVMGRSPYRKTVLQGKASKKVLLVIDCSGSMQGFHLDEGKVLVSALSLLAQQGFVTGHVALSLVTGGASMWQTFKLPMGQEEIDRIDAYGGAEGLEYTLKANISKAKEADYTFVYTDAQICDKPIDKTGLHRQGVYTWGLYAGEEGKGLSTADVLSSMIKYFDKAIIRSTADDLADAILAQSK